MENLKKFMSLLKDSPNWLRWVVSILLSALLSIYLLCSCGTTRAVVHNGASDTSTEIKITTNNPTSVTASPNVTLKHSSDYE